MSLCTQIDCEIGDGAGGEEYKGAKCKPRWWTKMKKKCFSFWKKML